MAWSRNAGAIIRSMTSDTSAVAHGAPVPPMGGALDPLVGPQCSLAVQLRRATGSVIGRTAELDAIAQEIREATGRLCRRDARGRAGHRQDAPAPRRRRSWRRRAGFTCVAITADEEIRGPFLVARSLFAQRRVATRPPGRRRRPRSGAWSRPSRPRRARLRDPLARRQAPPGLRPRGRRDRAALASADRLLLIDDVQWADDDTLRMLRYVVRSVAERPVFLFLTIRPDELATVPEAVNFVADMERMGLVRRLRLGGSARSRRRAAPATVLGGPVEGQSAAAMHAQSEGVPFIVEELPGRTARPARSSRSRASGGSGGTRRDSCRPRCGR